MKSATNKRARRNPQGFSLIEFLVVVAIFAIIMGVATEGVIQLGKRSRSDTAKVDKTQEARQFMDQIVNDIHQAGFPNSRMYDPCPSPCPSPSPTPSPTPSPNNVAVGLVSVDSNALQFEGDVDGSGNVSEVYIQLVVPSGGCPCVLQRGTILKSQVGSGVVPYYTEVDYVMNQNIFSAYFYDGTSVNLPASATDLLNIKTIRMTLNVRPTAPEMDGTYNTITMASEAKINN